MSRDVDIHILLAEDDPDDRLLTRRALAESRLSFRVTAVENGEELLRYLRREEEYGRSDGSRGAAADNGSGGEANESRENGSSMEGEEVFRPDLILLDLNMPRMDGREALREIKSDPDLRRIPVVVLTTSEADQDILQSYNLGVNAFVTKPVSFDDLTDAMDSLSAFWFDLVKLPPEHDSRE